MEENIDGLFALARERYRIFLAKEAGEPPPWTEDPILRDYHVCNVFRDDDRVSRCIMRRVLPKSKSPMVTVAACRLINNESSILSLMPAGDLPADWSVQVESLKLNTSAYKINTPDGLNSRQGIRRLIGATLAATNRATPGNLRQASTLLRSTGLTPFIAYQAAHDLKGAVIPPKPDDADTWTMIGSGAVRGALRLSGLDVERFVAGSGYTAPADGTRLLTMPGGLIPKAVRDFGGSDDQEAWGLGVALRVLEESRDPGLWPSDWPRWHLSEAEHMLCEYDKICRWRLIGTAGARRFHPPSTQAGLF